MLASISVYDLPVLLIKTTDLALLDLFSVEGDITHITSSLKAKTFQYSSEIRKLHVLSLRSGHKKVAELFWIGFILYFNREVSSLDVIYEKRLMRRKTLIVAWKTSF